MQLSRSSLLPVLVGLAGGPVFAQCHIATVEAFDPLGRNPIRLTSVEPGRYAVPGTATILEAGNARNHAANALLVTARKFGGSGIPVPPHRYDLLVDPGTSLLQLASSSQPPRWTFLVPNDTSLLDASLFAQSFHFDGLAGIIDASNGLEFRVGWIHADIAVTSVIPASNLVGGVGPRPHRVTLRNFGNVAVMVPVTVAFWSGSNMLTWGNAVLGPVPPFGTFASDVFVPTPASFGATCGNASNSFELRACTMLADCNPANDCANSPARVAVPYWDIRLQVVGAPSQVCRGTSFGYSVRVVNAGNVASPNVCCITGIDLFSGAGNWGANLGTFNFTTPNLGPGAETMVPIPNYFVNCGALTQTQFLKTEIWYSNRCFDNCTPGNYHEVPINIVRCGC